MGCHPLEFVTTATCRPKIVDATYRSFVEKMSGVNWKRSTLYINIDPMPEGRDPQAIIDIGKKYFGKVEANVPEKAHFTKALHWCFQQPQEEMFFYLQDDWRLVKRVKIQDLKVMLNSDVRYSKYSNKRAKVINVVLRAYSAIRDNRICLSPSLINTEWAKEYSNRLDFSLNPERQFRPKSKVNQGGGQASSPLHVGVQFPKDPRWGIYVKDLGRGWLKHNGFKRNAKAWNFNHWVEIGAKHKKKPKDTE